MNRLNRLVDEVMGGGGRNGGSVASAWTPACDVREDKEHLTIALEVPGVRSEDIRISLENQVLTIRGEKRQVSEANGERRHRYERSYGSFERSFTLPASGDGEHIEANVADGVLTLTLPKAERAKRREIAIKSGQK